MSSFLHLGIYPGSVTHLDATLPEDTWVMARPAFAKFYWRLKAIAVRVKATVFGGFPIDVTARAERRMQFYGEIGDERELEFPGADSTFVEQHIWDFSFRQQFNQETDIFQGSGSMTFNRDDVVPSFTTDKVIASVRLAGQGTVEGGIEYDWKFTNIAAEADPGAVLVDLPVKYQSGNIARPTHSLSWNGVDGSPDPAGIDAGTLECELFFTESYLYDHTWLLDYENDTRQN